MTAPVATQLEVAAIPTAISALQIFQQFEADVGSDPATMVANFEPAKIKAFGALGLLVAPLIKSEVVAGESVVNAVAAGWITKLQAVQAAAAKQ